MFNNYFVNEVKDDTCNLHDSSKFIYENQMYKDQNEVRSEFKFRFVDTVEMEKVIRSIKIEKYFGFDDNPINVIKNAKQKLSEILCHLIIINS